MMSSKELLAGAAQVDTTPPMGTFINGDFVPHYAQFIHDPLHAKAVVFQQGETLAAIVVVDICVMPKEFLDGIKEDMKAKTGIAPENVVISSTHTHAAGSVASVYLSSADLNYMRKLPGLIVQAVVNAKQRLRPAQIAWGTVDVPEHVLSRRYKMRDHYLCTNPVFGTTDELKTNPFGGESHIQESVGAIDPEVSFFAVKGTDGKYISLVANYSLHYVGDWANGTISADYFAVFAEGVKSRLNAGDDFVGIMSNGTSGNINIWDFKNPDRYPSEQFQKSKLIGEDIAGRVIDALQNAKWEDDAQLAVQYSELTIDVRKPTADELTKAKTIVAESTYENLQVTHIGGLKELYAREQIFLNELSDTEQFPVQAFKIGSGAVGAMGAEMFAETGLWLKEKSPVNNYFSICLANGATGYVPPEHEFNNGGYETWRSRASHLEKTAEDKIKTKLLQLINQVAN